jgi:hypothetical protein
MTIHIKSLRGGMINLMHTNIDPKKDELEKISIVLEKDEKEPEIRPEFVKEIRKIEKEPSIKIKDIDTFFDED